MFDATKVIQKALQIMSIFTRSHLSVPVWLWNSISRQKRDVIAFKMHASTANVAETPSVLHLTIPSTDAYLTFSTEINSELLIYSACCGEILHSIELGL